MSTTRRPLLTDVNTYCPKESGTNKPAANKNGKENSVKNQTDCPTEKKETWGPLTQEDKERVRDQAILALGRLEKDLENDPENAQIVKDFFGYGLRCINEGTIGWMTRRMESTEMYGHAMKRANRLSKKAKKPTATGKENSAKNPTDRPVEKKKKNSKSLLTNEERKLVRNQAALASTELEKTLKNYPAGLKAAKEYIAKSLRKVDGKNSWMLRGKDWSTMHHAAMDHAKGRNKKEAGVANMSRLEEYAAEAIKMLERELADDPNELAITRDHITHALQRVKQKKASWMTSRKEMDPDVMCIHAMRNLLKDKRRAVEKASK